MWSTASTVRAQTNRSMDGRTDEQTIPRALSPLSAYNHLHKLHDNRHTHTFLGLIIVTLCYKLGVNHLWPRTNWQTYGQVLLSALSPCFASLFNLLCLLIFHCDCLLKSVIFSSSLKKPHLWYYPYYHTVCPLTDQTKLVQIDWLWMEPNLVLSDVCSRSWTGGLPSSIWRMSIKAVTKEWNRVTWEQPMIDLGHLKSVFYRFRDLKVNVHYKMPDNPPQTVW